MITISYPWTEHSPGVGDPAQWAIHRTNDPTFVYEVRFHLAGIARFCYEWDAERFVAHCRAHAHEVAKKNEGGA